MLDYAQWELLQFIFILDVWSLYNMIHLTLVIKVPSSIRRYFVQYHQKKRSAAEVDVLNELKRFLEGVYRVILVMYMYMYKVMRVLFFGLITVYQLDNLKYLAEVWCTLVKTFVDVHFLSQTNFVHVNYYFCSVLWLNRTFVHKTKNHYLSVGLTRLSIYLFTWSVSNICVKE